MSKTTAGVRVEPGQELLTPAAILYLYIQPSRACGRKQGRVICQPELQLVGIPAFRAPRRSVAWKCGEVWAEPWYPLTQRVPFSAPFKNVLNSEQVFLSLFTLEFLGSALPGWARERPFRLQNIPLTCRWRPNGFQMLQSIQSFSAQSFPPHFPALSHCLILLRARCSLLISH